MSQCIEGFYGNKGYDNITPSYLGTGLVKFQAVGASGPGGSVTVQVSPDGTVQDNNVLNSMGCTAVSHKPASEYSGSRYTSTQQYEAGFASPARDGLEPPSTEPGRESPVMAAIGEIGTSGLTNARHLGSEDMTMETPDRRRQQCWLSTTRCLRSLPLAGFQRGRSI